MGMLVVAVVVVAVVVIVSIRSFRVIGPAEVGLVTKRFGRRLTDA